MDAFVCLISIAAPEVADVLTRKSVTGKLVMGMDSDQRTIEGIQNGMITATLGQKPFTMAYLAIKMLDELHHHPPASLMADFSRDAFSPLPTVRGHRRNFDRQEQRGGIRRNPEGRPNQEMIGRGRRRRCTITP